MFQVHFRPYMNLSNVVTTEISTKLFSSQDYLQGCCLAFLDFCLIFEHGIMTGVSARRDYQGQVGLLTRRSVVVLGVRI